MKKSEAISLAFKHLDRFPVMVWQEGSELVTEVDGNIIRAATAFDLDTKLDGFAPQPRNLYFIDEPFYENAEHENQCDGCRQGLPVVNGLHRDKNDRPFMACTKQLYKHSGTK